MKHPCGQMNQGDVGQLRNDLPPKKQKTLFGNPGAAMPTLVHPVRRQQGCGFDEVGQKRRR
jgi:hypothetical protein